MLQVFNLHCGIAFKTSRNLGYPDVLILVGAYIRWIFSGFKRKKLERYLDEDQDRINFIVFFLVAVLLVLVVIFVRKVVLGYQ
jgi:uncharacterized membrane protein YidH (DUF202 family)